MDKKQKKFNTTLIAASNAFNNVGIKFHIHYGTALGAIREKKFIKHDDDIDIAVFYKDVNKASQVASIIKEMKLQGFTHVRSLGQLTSGKELTFELNDVPIDVFWVYDGEYKGRALNIVMSYLGKCDDFPKKKCVFGYTPYKTVPIKFLGNTYQTIPTSTIVEAYGPNWKTPLKYNYFEGLDKGYNSGMISDYFNPPVVDTKVAFCFLLYDSIVHRKIWETFFKQDLLSDKSYSIYSHLKEATDKTPGWIKDARVKSVPTDYCGAGIALAWATMLREALKDPMNKYFTILSGECIPLCSFDKTIKTITKLKKSMITPQMVIDKKNGIYLASQWTILTRDAAKKLVSLYDTDRGAKYLEFLKKHNTDPEDDETLCPDEYYPISWFAHNYGPPTSSTFKQKFNTKPSTWIKWNYNRSIPYKINSTQVRKFRSNICKSGSLFGRKFTKPAANEIAMTCN